MAHNQNNNDSFQSPNAIPPRTSSTGIVNYHSAVNPSKPVLRPVPEADWMSPHKRMGSNADLRSRGNSLVNDGALAWSHVKENIVLSPYEYVADQPGKDIRKQLIQSFNAWLKVPEEKLAVITRVITMLHNASLLVDDVEDGSFLRRGSPVAHSVFGVAQTINSGNYVYFLALQELLKLGNPTLVNIYSEELCNLHRGQGMDLYWRDTLTCPSEEDYLEMVSNKTGGLFRLTIKLMQAESTVKKDCLPLVNTIGLIFQIRDDYMNLFSTDYTQNKGLCEDLTEGKFSFPVIHSIRSNPSNLQLINILKQKTNDPAVKKYAVSIMEKTGSFAYCRQVVGELLERAETMAQALDAGAGESVGVQAILKKFSIEDI